MENINISLEDLNIELNRIFDNISLEHFLPIITQPTDYSQILRLKQEKLNELVEYLNNLNNVDVPQQKERPYPSNIIFDENQIIHIYLDSNINSVLWLYIYFPEVLAKIFYYIIQGAKSIYIHMANVPSPDTIFNITWTNRLARILQILPCESHLFLNFINNHNVLGIIPYVDYLHFGQFTSIVINLTYSNKTEGFIPYVYSVKRVLEDCVRIRLLKQEDIENIMDPKEETYIILKLNEIYEDQPVNIKELLQQSFNNEKEELIEVKNIDDENKEKTEELQKKSEEGTTEQTEEGE